MTNGPVDITDTRKLLLPDFTGTTLVEVCPSSVCTSPENAKIVTVNITWKEGVKVQTLKMQTLIGEGGLNK